MGEYFCDICKFYDDDVTLLSQIELLKGLKMEFLLKVCCFGGVVLYARG